MNEKQFKYFFSQSLYKRSTLVENMKTLPFQDKHFQQEMTLPNKIFVDKIKKELHLRITRVNQKPED